MTDSDLVAELEPEHVDPLAAWLASAYYIPLDRLRSAVAARSSCNFIHLATMFKIERPAVRPRGRHSGARTGD
jgi:hypothetical protein